MEEKKRKISWRKVMQLFVTLVVTAGCVLAMSSASKVQDKRAVKEVRIHIRNEKSCGFLDKEQLYGMLIGNRHIDVNHTPVSRLNIKAMEGIMLSNPWVASAQVYVDNARMLHIYVTQSVPVVRIFEQNGNSYYLDGNMKTLPLSEHYAHYAPVVNNVPVLKDDSAGNSVKAQILKLATTIARDTFWSAQVAEINMTSNRRFELVPVLGSHRVVIGDTSQLEEKLSNIFAFYSNVLNRIGWDKYEVVDASFNGQVVASPALKWHMPRDKAMSDMNWVKTIMESAPKSDISMDAAAQPLPDEHAAVSAPAPQPKVTTQVAVAPMPAVAERAEPKPNQAVAVPKKVVAQPAKNREQHTTAGRSAAVDKKKTNTGNPARETNKEERTPKYIYQGNNH